MTTLRPYQTKAINGLRAEYRRGHRAVLFVLPTGGGKTVCFSHVAQQAALRGGRVLVLVHRVELLEQASRSLQQAGVAHGLIAAGRPMDLQVQVQVASVQTVARRLHKLPPDLFSLLVVDEAHHTVAGTWASVVDHFHAAKLLGVTATPIRTDGRGLGEMYQAMVLGPGAKWLTDAGFLAPARVFAPPIGFSTKGLRKRMGDYDMKDAGEQLSAVRIMGDVVGHYRRLLDQRTAIAFCCSVKHAEVVALTFQSQGIRAESIDGTMSTDRRRELLEQLGSGELKVLTSCALIGEGVDVPSVGGCILLRPTQSEALHLQMIGRCLRPQDGKEAVVLDHVGNVQRLGHHLEDREWTLDGRRVRARDGEAPEVKMCPACFAVTVKTAQVCPECGHVFAPEARPMQVVNGELQEVTPGQVKRLRFQEQAQATTLEDLIAVGVRRGMKNPRGWARHVMAARQAKGHWRAVR